MQPPYVGGQRQRHVRTLRRQRIPNPSTSELEGPFERVLPEEGLWPGRLALGEVLSAEGDVHHDGRLVATNGDGWLLPDRDLADRRVPVALHRADGVRR